MWRNVASRHETYRPNQSISMLTPLCMCLNVLVCVCISVCVCVCVCVHGVYPFALPGQHAKRSGRETLNVFHIHQLLHPGRFFLSGWADGVCAHNLYYTVCVCVCVCGCVCKTGWWCLYVCERQGKVMTETETEMYEIEMCRCVREICTGVLNGEKWGKEPACSAVSLRSVMAAG